MPSFSGVHGTTSKHASDIQHVGFVINPQETYQRMFGNGVYMYKNDENGKRYAREWANYKMEKERIEDEYACILLIDFCFTDNEHITWSDDEELKFNNWLNRERKNIAPNGILNRKIQNEYRMRFVSAAAIRMSIRYKVIFADMPFPKHLSDHGKNRYGACAVKDNRILPKPPYEQA